jgi:plasmid stabilization system protein ParE
MLALSRPRFLFDFSKEMLWLNERVGSDIAIQFHNSVEQTIEILMAQPLMGRVRNDLKPKGIRSWRVLNFPRWLIFYQVIDETIVLLRLRHGSMNIPALPMRS